MATIPIFLKTNEDRPCLVVGGGVVALRKVEWLLACGGRVRVVSPELDPELERLARGQPDRLELNRQAYESHDLGGYTLAIAGTGNREVNRLVFADARKAGIPVNVVDDPELCTFYVPATVHRGELQLTVGTGGGCPSLAARLRRELEESYPEWYERYISALRVIRARLPERVKDPERRRALLDHLASRQVSEALKELDLEGMVEALERAARDWLMK